MGRRALALAGLALLLPLAAAQQGDVLGVSPARVVVSDAVAGEAYQAVLTVQSGFAEPTRVELGLEGDLAPWSRTEPAGSVEVPARGRATVLLLVDVPPGAAVGTHRGVLRLTAAAPDAPANGTGAGLQYAVGVALNFTVGGDPREAVQWLAVTAETTEESLAPVVLVRVRNAGNVRTTVNATAEAVDADGNVLASGRASESLVPGVARDLRVALDALPVGRYEVHARGEGPGAPFEGSTVLEVVPAGALGRSGRIVDLAFTEGARTGEPVRATVRFENTGESPIQRARLVLEAHHDGRLVGVAEGEALAVPAQATVPLVAYWTPATGGSHRLVATVVYDGLQSEAAESSVEVAGGAAAPTAPAALAVLAIALLAALRRR